MPILWNAFENGSLKACNKVLEGRRAEEIMEICGGEGSNTTKEYGLEKM